VNAIGTTSPNSAATNSSEGREVSGSSADRADSEEYYDYDQAPSNNGDSGPFTNYNEVFANLMKIEIPDQEDAPNKLLVFDSYQKAMNAIKEDTNVAFGTHCIVCKGQHRFENCPTLNNHKFLKKHYIRFCQNVCRDHTELQLNREPVNFMDQRFIDDSGSASEGDAWDFPYGHR